MYYRTLEERNYSSRHITFLQHILDGEDSISRFNDLDPTEHLPALTRLDAYRMVHRCVRDYD